MRVTAAIIALFILVPVFYKEERIKERIAAGILSLFSCVQALAPLTPFEPLRAFLQWATVTLVFPSLLSLILLLVELHRPHLYSYQRRIIDSLREYVLLFDMELRPFSTGFRLHGLPNEAFQYLSESMRRIIRDRPAQKKLNLEGLLPYLDKTFRYRCRGVEKGYLVTLLDITEEQILLNQLVEKNSALLRQTEVLTAMEEYEVIAKQDQYHRAIGEQMNNLVYHKLQQLNTSLESPLESIDSVLACAEDTMADIRLTVSRLVKEG